MIKGTATALLTPHPSERLRLAAPVTSILIDIDHGRTARVTPEPAPKRHPWRVTQPANPKADEQEVLADILTQDADPPTTHPGQTGIRDKGHVSKHLMADHGLTLLRPSYRNKKPRPGEHCSSRSGSRSSRSTTPSKASRTSNTTEPQPQPES
ncbi:hypothetical protein ACIGEZ_32315 [Streptomyces sp. NPDC085481]|uniref:hypothetical protein n=1 Tax=Streptomyces sp. NPDC085481 TaxID=3365727 RepID=UPI0037D281B5